jgi:hypothetical protein
MPSDLLFNDARLVFPFRVNVEGNFTLCHFDMAVRSLAPWNLPPTGFLLSANSK